jgi:hypothetical protein
MGINDKKGKSREDYVELMILYLFKFYELCTIKGDTLDELVQCKPSKIYPTTKTHV